MNFEHVLELADSYAMKKIYDPERHMDAVRAAQSDYLAGFRDALLRVTGGFEVIAKQITEYLGDGED